jgi:DDE superfamily endonuclease
VLASAPARTLFIATGGGFYTDCETVRLEKLQQVRDVLGFVGFNAHDEVPVVRPADLHDLVCALLTLDAHGHGSLFTSESCHRDLRRVASRMQSAQRRKQQPVFDESLATLLDSMEAVRPAFTVPGFRNAWVVFAGWVMTVGVHAVTQALVVTDVARRVHHERFHRFFSRGAWRPDAVGRLVLNRIVKQLCPQGRLVLALDDTLVSKKGPEVFGIGSHLDPVRSTKRVLFFCFGHVWVVLAVVVHVPFSPRKWALPVLMRLYRNKSECERAGHPYRKKTELGREMVDLVTQWLVERDLDVVADSAYCNDTLTRGLDKRIRVIGSIRPDAVLTAAPTSKERKATGRRRKRGKLLPKPKKIFKSARYPWLSAELYLYGRKSVVSFKTLQAQWYRGAGEQLGRIVIVRMDHGAIPMRVFFCTDGECSAQDVLFTYAGRWSLEVCFRDIKQLLGFGDSCARKQAAVERVAPFVAYAYTILVLWFADGVWMTQLAAFPIRPWYKYKRHACFADVLRAAQRVLVCLDVLDPTRGYANLRELGRHHRQPAAVASRRAA